MQIHGRRGWYFVAWNRGAKQRELGTRWLFHPSMLGTVCERCPAGCSVTKTISVRWSQAGRRAGSEGDELPSGSAEQHRRAPKHSSRLHATS